MEGCHHDKLRVTAVVSEATVEAALRYELCAAGPSAVTVHPQLLEVGQ